MEETGIIRRFDDLGRINIPKEFRRRLFPLINEDFEGQPMEMCMNGNEIIIRRYINSSEYCKWEDTESLRDKGVEYSTDGLYKPGCNNDEDDFRNWELYKAFQILSLLWEKDLYSKLNREYNNVITKQGKEKKCSHVSKAAQLLLVNKFE